MVAADADRIVIGGGADLGRISTADECPVFSPTVFFEHRKLRQDPPRFADVGVLRQSVLGADHVRTEPQSWPTGPAIGARDLGLQPVQQRQTELFGAVDVGRLLVRIDAHEVAQQVIVLRPVDQADVRAVGAGFKVLLVGDPAIGPQVQRSTLRLPGR